MSLFPHVTRVFLDKVIGLLVPLFLTTAGEDMEAAREAAESTLASYDVETEEEIRLAAEITSLGFGVLDALAKAMDPNLPLNAVLRLRGSANALHRSAHQCQRALDKLRKQRDMPASQTQVPEPTAEVAEIAPTDPAEPQIQLILSRQQRRALQRASEKAQRRHAEQARRDAMRAMRIVTAPIVAAAQSCPERIVPDQAQAA